MTKIDLITGFLGAGKTTFLKRYLDDCLDKGERICVLEFDYGAVNVDMMLLQDYEGRIDAEMVAGGCDADCHLRRFKTKLVAMGMKKYDRVIVEPSGIFDVDEFFDSLYEEPLSNWYEIGSVVCILDSGLPLPLSSASEDVLCSEIGTAGVVVLSKTQFHTAQEIEKTLSAVKSILSSRGLDFSKKKLIQKSFSELTKTDFERIRSASFEECSLKKASADSYESVYFLNPELTLPELRLKAFALLGEGEYGNVLRIKGFLKEGDRWFEVNLTQEDCDVRPIKNGQSVLILIGEHLKEGQIRSFFLSK